MADLGFRRWEQRDLPFMWEMLYQSLYVRDSGSPFPRQVLEEPAIAHYLTDFGTRHGDDAQICTADAEPVGAAWCRLMTSEDPGYGYVRDDVPEVGMAVEARWRGRGIGRGLLEDLLGRHPAMSLSVDDENTVAAGLYRSLGFVPVETVGGSTTMYHSGG